MNAGLSNLTSLKAAVFPAALRAQTQWDAALTALGRGVADSLEGFCNRLFAYTAGDTFICEGNKLSICVPRFPIVTVTALEMRQSPAGAWVSLGTVDQAAVNLIEDAGIVQLGSIAGTYFERLRVTYTGGYFYETLEPTEGGYPTAVPSGSTAVPPDLLHAWHLQCQAEIEASGLLRAVSAEPKPKVGNARMVSEFRGLTDRVVEMLQGFIRYA